MGVVGLGVSESSGKRPWFSHETFGVFSFLAVKDLLGTSNLKIKKKKIGERSKSLVPTDSKLESSGMGKMG